jgi:HSF-type DNA-binding
MNSTILDQNGLSNLVEAATALANFSLGSIITPTISPDQMKPQSILPRHVNDVAQTSAIITNTNNSGLAEANKETFPERLLAILNDKDVSSDVIAWLPNGDSFIIARPDIFMESILPKYIPPDSNRSINTATVNSKITPSYCTKYPSFTRKLNRWYEIFH